MERVKEILIWIRHFFTYNKKKENWKVVVLCLLAATTFWFFNALNKSYTTRIYYPIMFSIKRDNIIIIDKLPERVRLDVTGGGWNLLKKTVSFKRNPIIIPLENPVETKYLLGSSLRNLISDQLDVLKLNFIVTDTLFVNIDKKVERKIPVKVDSSGISLANAYRIISPIKISPDSISLSGPFSLIDTLPNVFLIKIPYEEIDEDFNEEIEIEGFEETKHLTFSPHTFKISFKVEEFLNQKMKIDVELSKFPKSPSVFLKDNQITVSFWTRKENLDKIKKEDFEVIANYKKIHKKDSTILTELVKQPPYAFDISIEPLYVKVGYEK